MQDGVLLGIDLGTSSVKALAVTPGGEVVGRGAGAYEIDWIQEGWAEQDPEAWWAATVAAVRESLSRAGATRPRVLAIGLSGQVNGVLPIDRKGRPLRRAVIWLDQRSAHEAEHINAVASDLLATSALGRAAPIHAAAKVLWLLGHEAERMRGAWKVLFPKDFLTYRFTGTAVTDVTDGAASLMLDLRRRAWAGEVLDRLEIPQTLLPDVVESPTVVGAVGPAAAEALGVAAGVPVVAGAGDMTAVAPGTGVIHSGIACTILGTAGQIAIFAASPPDRPVDGAWPMTAPIPGAYLWHGLVMTAAYCMAWLSRILGGDESGAAALAGEAEAAPPGSRGLIFLPFLDGAATPHADPRARAVLLGATSVHGRAEMARAVMEGVAYNVRDAFEVFSTMGHRVERIRLGGGGSRSPLWCRILADVIGIDLEVVEDPDASALGAAIIAGVGTGVFGDFAAACRAIVRVGHAVATDPARRRLYDEYYAIYREVYPSVRTLTHALTDAGRREPILS